MTRMERRRRRRRILRIKLATTAAVLALTTASIVALTGGAAETASEPTPQPPALQAEPVLLVAEHDSTYQPVQMTPSLFRNRNPSRKRTRTRKSRRLCWSKAICMRRSRWTSTCSAT